MIKIKKQANTGWGKSRSKIVSTRNIVYSCIINYCIIFYANNCKPTFAHMILKGNYQNILRLQLRTGSMSVRFSKRFLRIDIL